MAVLFTVICSAARLGGVDMMKENKVGPTSSKKKTIKSFGSNKIINTTKHLFSAPTL